MDGSEATAVDELAEPRPAILAEPETKCRPSSMIFHARSGLPMVSRWRIEPTAG
jgi:hypothetical protein